MCPSSLLPSSLRPHSPPSRPSLTPSSLLLLLVTPLDSYHDILLASELSESWTKVHRRLKDTAPFSHAQASLPPLPPSLRSVPGVRVNATPSIRATSAAADKHGRGFDWKFNFFEKHAFATQADALLWARRYLKRQVGQKLALKRDVTGLERMLGAKGVTIADVVAEDGEGGGGYVAAIEDVVVEEEASGAAVGGEDGANAPAGGESAQPERGSRGGGEHSANAAESGGDGGGGGGGEAVPQH
jgi:hypothetical protein